MRLCPGRFPRAGSSSDLAEPWFDGIGGPDLLSLGKGLVAKAGEQIVEIIAQAGDDLLGQTGSQRSAKRRVALSALWQLSAFMTALLNPRLFFRRCSGLFRQRVPVLFQDCSCCFPPFQLIVPSAEAGASFFPCIRQRPECRRELTAKDGSVFHVIVPCANSVAAAAELLPGFGSPALRAAPPSEGGDGDCIANAGPVFGDTGCRRPRSVAPPWRRRYAFGDVFAPAAKQVAGTDASSGTPP